MAAAETPAALDEGGVRVSLAWSLAPRTIQEKALVLPKGATLADAVAQAQHLWPELAQGPELAWSVWGRQVPASQVLQTGDRVEGTRALRVDPKVARRERFARQGARTAGLFSKRQRR